MITSVVCISHVHVLSITPTFLIVQPSLDSNKYPICTNVQVLIKYDGNWTKQAYARRYIASSPSFLQDLF